MKTYPGPADDPIWASERIDELEKLNAELLAALARTEVKLRAYLGVCKDDKELRETVLPMAAAAIAKVEFELLSINLELLEVVWDISGYSYCLPQVFLDKARAVAEKAESLRKKP